MDLHIHFASALLYVLDMLAGHLTRSLRCRINDCTAIHRRPVEMTLAQQSYGMQKLQPLALVPVRPPPGCCRIDVGSSWLECPKYGNALQLHHHASISP